MRGPDLWFADALDVGLAEPLELAAVAQALAGLPMLPTDCYLAVNVSPATACSPALAGLLAGTDLRRLVLEITEQQATADVATLLVMLAPLRAAGLRLAIDDAGVGYSGLQKILELRPDIIKLDRFFVTGIDADPSRRALAAALADFAGVMGAELVAEGVETEAELAAIALLGFAKVQGWLLGRPMTLAALAEGQ
nr:EAL domain-containing protein [Polymorphobacter multimanifer]